MMTTATERNALERRAIEAVCPTGYRDLMDMIDDMSDDELRALIEGRTPCPSCGLGTAA